MTDKPPLVDLVRDLSERRLSAAEFEDWVSAPGTDAERREVLDLIRWFTRRYPTPADRLAYVRKAYARLTRTRSSARRA